MGTVDLTEEQLLARTARFADLHRAEGGFPDSDIPGCERTLLNVLGYEPPEKVEGGEQVVSPVGDDASAASAIPVSEGVNIGFVECTPGHGVISHDHDTNETFTVISGRWRFTCNDADDLYVEIGPLDTVSFPAGVERRFTCMSNDEGGLEGRCLLLVAVAGNAPRAIMQDSFLKEARETGARTAQVEFPRSYADQA